MLRSVKTTFTCPFLKTKQHIYIIIHIEHLQIDTRKAVTNIRLKIVLRFNLYQPIIINTLLSHSLKSTVDRR